VNFIIISGQSGAGKSQAKKVFEDLGYYCVDNLPPSLIPSFTDLLEQNSENINNVALVIDIRGGKFFKDLENHLALLKQKGYPYRVFYFEADDDVLLKRYKENRRTHPLDPSGRIDDAIQAEKQMLSSLRLQADFVINTNTTTQAQLKKAISEALDLTDTQTQMQVAFVSFGYKKGLPLDADFIFDVRFLPNPYYIEELRPMTGNDAAVSDYVMSHDESKNTYDHLKRFLDFMIPQMIKDGRAQLVVGIGCTGGQHRSVTFANLLASDFKSRGYHAIALHRDVRKEA